MVESDVLVLDSQRLNLTCVALGVRAALAHKLKRPTPVYLWKDILFLPRFTRRIPDHPTLWYNFSQGFTPASPANPSITPISFGGYLMLGSGARGAGIKQIQLERVRLSSNPPFTLIPLHFSDRLGYRYQIHLRCWSREVIHRPKQGRDGHSADRFRL